MCHLGNFEREVEYLDTGLPSPIQEPTPIPAAEPVAVTVDDAATVSV